MFCVSCFDEDKDDHSFSLDITRKKGKEKVKNTNYANLKEIADKHDILYYEIDSIDGKRTKDYNDWIECNNFKVENKFKTYFQFSDCKEAKSVFSNIWGADIGNKVRSNIIEQNIVIYTYEI